MTEVAWAGVVDLDDFERAALEVWTPGPRSDLHSMSRPEGEEGAVLSLLRSQLRGVMGQIGAPRIADIRRSHVTECR